MGSGGGAGATCSRLSEAPGSTEVLLCTGGRGYPILHTERIHTKMTRPSTPARYGVEAAREPKPKIMNCWMKEPPDLPSGLPGQGHGQGVGWSGGGGGQ